MKTNRNCAPMVFLLISFVLLLSSCSSEPYVTRYMTVGEYNDMQEFSNSIVGGMGYQTKSHKASMYYKYVLFDGHKRCSEGGEFCTQSDSRDHISPNDCCLKCGRTWKNHDEY